MKKNTKHLLALGALAAACSVAHAQQDPWVTFSNANPTPSTVSSYLPNPSSYGAAASPTNATPGTTAGDAAYARYMRAEYAKDALANSTANAEATMRSESTKSANCQQIVTSADTAKKAYVVRHVAPDPTQVIKNSTCFVDVMKIKIPKSGSSIVDGLVGKLADFVSNSQCSSTSNYWGNISKAASSGNVSGLTTMSVTNTGYVPQTVYTAPTSTPTGSDTGWVTQPSTVSPTGTVTTTAPAAATSAPAPSLMDSIVGFIRP